MAKRKPANRTTAKRDVAKLTRFDAADYLSTPEDIAAYLSEAFESGDEAFIAAALGDVARAEGFSAIAERTGLTRQGLHKALSAGGSPKLATVLKVLDVIGLQLVTQPKAAA